MRKGNNSVSLIKTEKKMEKKKEMTNAERKALLIRRLLNDNFRRIFIEGHIEDKSGEIYDKLTDAECALLDSINEIVNKAKTDEEFADMILGGLDKRSVWINPQIEKEGK